MANKQDVKRYLGYWFQLGKKVIILNGADNLKPQKVIDGDRYSEEFEACWQKILSPSSGECYLEGTEETISQLLTPDWDIMGCARCFMPIPVKNAGFSSEICPCHNMPNWPNMELPPPRSPIDTKEKIMEIRNRLAMRF
jgi:hypothetical protein